MYLLKVFADIAHDVLIRADTYKTVPEAAYFLGENPSRVYNWINQRTKSEGILKFVEFYKI